jgi:Arc/MetJ-type ribon-helix-helix transcriptional regulator
MMRTTSMFTEPRSRMISFRLTPQEYDRFFELCTSCGLRSVSELVRAAVNLMAGQSHPNQPLPNPEIQARIAAIEFRLADLASALGQMETRVATGHAKLPNSVDFEPTVSGQL